MKKNGNWYIVSLVLVFVVGLLAGTLGGIQYERRNFEPRMDNMKPGLKERMDGKMGDRMPRPDMNNPRQGIVDMMTKDLSLREDQVDELEKILEKNEERFFSLRKEMKNKFETFRKETFEELKKILDEDQVKKLEEIDKERETMMKRMKSKFGGRGMHDGGPVPGGDDEWMPPPPPPGAEMFEDPPDSEKH